MDITHKSSDLLHLSVSPGIKSWSIFVGIMSVGFGGSYYSSDEHLLMKIAYLIGCLILGLTFLDDWEDCVFDLVKCQITMTRRNWLERLTSRCSESSTLVLDSATVMEVTTVQIKNSWNKSSYQVALVLRAGVKIPISETTYGVKGEQEFLARTIKQFLCLDRVEVVSRNSWAESDEEDFHFMFQAPLEVESLKGSGNFNYEELSVENENIPQRLEHPDTDSSSGEEDMFIDF